MKVAEIPFFVGHQLFQTAQELRGLAAYYPPGPGAFFVIDETGRRGMGDDVVDGKIVGRQVLGSIVEVRFRRFFLGPPRDTGPTLGLVRRFGAAEGEEGLVLDGEDFTAQEMVEIRPQFVHPAAGPFFDGIAAELVKVFVITIDEEDRVRHSSWR